MGLIGEVSMRGMRYRILWRLVPFLLISSLLIPSCGFIGLLFDSGKDGKSTQYYDLQMGYDCWGELTVDYTKPLSFLFIPLNNNHEFDDQSFDNASYKVVYIPSGVITMESLKEGPYAVLGYIDSDGDGELSMGEVYAFYYMRDLVSTFRDPDYIMVDSSIGYDMPHFDLYDTYEMDGFAVLYPVPGDTVHGEGLGMIYMVGLKIEETISTVEILIDDIAQDKWPAEQEIFPINMSTKLTGFHSLGIIARDAGGSFVSFDMTPLNVPFDFYYEAP